MLITSNENIDILLTPNPRHPRDVHEAKFSLILRILL